MTRTDDSPVPDYASMLRLDGRRIIVVGAGNGIGRQASHALASMGARLCCVDVEPDLASEIAALPPLAVRAAKAAILDAADRQLDDGLARERDAFFALFDTDDQAEGMAAFTEKRPPVWSGH